MIVTSITSSSSSGGSSSTGRHNKITGPNDIRILKLSQSTLTQKSLPCIYCVLYLFLYLHFCFENDIQVKYCTNANILLLLAHE